MNAHSPHVRLPEMSASALESFGGQKTSNETYAQARALRRFIAAHPGCTAAEMPPECRGLLEFLLRQKLIAREGTSPRRYTVRPI
jgi:hypothetical protein